MRSIRGRTFYTDVSGTNGAWRWISTGTTNTSWVVVLGDTGVRSVALSSAWTGSLMVRRYGGTVAINFNGYGAAVNGTGSADPLVTLPVGFRPWVAINGPFRVGGVWTVATSGTVTSDSTTSNKTYQQFSWQTRESWPTSLPGASA